MPELPEVETIRLGLRRWICGRTIAAVQIDHPRAVRRHLPGPDDLAARLTGLTVEDVCRRGKYLWLTLTGAPAPQPPGRYSLARLGPDSPAPAPLRDSLVVHLGMSGQLLVQPPEAPPERHLRVRIGFRDGGPQLRFVDQRTFGGVFGDHLVAAPDGQPQWLPSSIAHIARDPLDPHLDPAGLIARLRRQHRGIKRALLDQTLVSGIGNIYADEALWRAAIHPERHASSLTRAQAQLLLEAVREVLTDALVAGGTSFDALYVDAHGNPGYFARQLNAYGRVGRPCARCGTPIQRAAFMNRSSFSCPRCQRPPRTRRI